MKQVDKWARLEMAMGVRNTATEKGALVWAIKRQHQVSSEDH